MLIRTKLQDKIRLISSEKRMDINFELKLQTPFSFLVGNQFTQFAVN